MSISPECINAWLVFFQLLSGDSYSEEKTRCDDKQGREGPRTRALSLYMKPQMIVSRAESKCIRWGGTCGTALNFQTRKSARRTQRATNETDPFSRPRRSKRAIVTAPRIAHLLSPTIRLDDSPRVVFSPHFKYSTLSTRSMIDARRPSND